MRKAAIVKGGARLPLLFSLLLFLSGSSFATNSQEHQISRPKRTLSSDAASSEEEFVKRAKKSFIDQDFSGKILVIGGTTKNHPEKISVNIKRHCDINGSGWDKAFMSRFSKEKYDHILFEHVGISLAQLNTIEKPVDPRELAKAYFNLLKPGGSFDLLTWGSIRACIESDMIKEFILGPLFGCYTAKIPILSVVLWNEDTNRFAISPDSYTFEDYVEPEVMQEKLIEALDAEPLIIESVQALAQAGFKKITLRTEQSGILGFTSSHSALHISAIKPE